MYYLKTDEKPETKTNMFPINIRAVTGLNLIQAIARIWFVYIMLTGGIGEFLEVSISTMTLNMIGAMFLLLGVAGVASVFAMLMRKSWALKALLAVNILTIILDVWGITVQSSAFLGFIVPLLTILMILKEKDNWGIIR